MTTQKYDMVIMGAGLIGSSIAYHLSKKQKSLRIALLDLDFKGQHSSSELNAGGARMEWCHEVNIQLAKATIEFLEKNPEQFGFRQKGYLWLYDANGWKTYKEHEVEFHGQGLSIEELTPQEVKRRYPFIDRTDDIVAATYSKRDGLFNPNLLKEFFRNSAKKNGVEFIDGAYIKAILRTEKINEVIFNDLCDEKSYPNGDDVYQILTGKSVIQDHRERSVRCDVLINSCGPWASKIAKLYDHDVPSKPVRRQISIFDCHELNLSDSGMIVDTSGVYFHPEANHILSGYATPNEAVGYNFKYDGDLFFEQEIWPRLANRMSRAQALKHIKGWAGLYEVTPDLSGVMGLIHEKQKIYEAHSFTGRGAMQSYGVGLAMAELILGGKYLSIEATSLHPRRFRLDKSKLLYEGLHI